MTNEFHGNSNRMLFRNFDFASLVRHELRRSERYCTFLSLLALRIDDLEESLKRRFPADDKTAADYRSRLLDVIRAHVRATDVVSVVHHNTVALLLVETPAEGAEVLGRRLSKHLRDYFTSSGDPLDKVDVDTDVGSYPEDRDSIERLLSEFVS